MSEKKSIPVVLIASLCLNAMLAGAVGASFFVERGEAKARMKERLAEGRQPRRGGPMEERLARAALNSLPGDERKQLRRALAREWRDTRDSRQDMKLARDELQAAISAQEFDIENVRGLFASIRSKDDLLRERMHERLIETLAKLPADTRKTLIEQTRARQAIRRERFGDRLPQGERPPSGERRDPPSEETPTDPLENE